MRSTRILTLTILLGSLATARADVTLYSLGDYMTSWSENGPSSQAFGVGRYNVNQLGKVKNNRSGSVKVPRGWRVELFEEADFKGASIAIDADQPWLDRLGWKDRTSSLIVSRPGPPLESAKQGWECTREGGWCEFRAPATIYYGYGDKWTKLDNVPGRIQCTNEAFGDPNIGAVKACFVHNEQPTIPEKKGRKCADEGGRCGFRGPATVYFGTGKHWIARQLPGYVDCTTANFGNPLANAQKECFVDGEQPLLTTRGPHKCADEGGTCKAFKGPHLYWYGAGTTWVKLELTGNVSCDSVTFTDPAPGVAKACYSDSWPDPR